MDARHTGTRSKREGSNGVQIKVLLLGAAIATGGVGTASGLEDPSPRPSRPAHIQTDDELEATIMKGILAHPEVFAARLRVEALRGFVTLRGTVRNKDAQATAEKIARSVPGVRGVKNQLMITPAKR